MIFPLKKDLTTQYQAHYKKPDSNLYGNGQNMFPNMSKQNNINPFGRKLKAPIGKETQYQLDYPNWKVT